MFNEDGFIAGLVDRLYERASDISRLELHPLRQQIAALYLKADNTDVIEKCEQQLENLKDHCYRLQYAAQYIQNLLEGDESLVHGLYPEINLLSAFFKTLIEYANEVDAEHRKTADYSLVNQI